MPDATPDPLVANASTPATVLLTGATGFIGRHVLQLLAQDADLRVHATSRRQPDPGEVPAGAEWHRVELSDPGAVDELVDAVRPELVLHLASHVAGSRDVSLVRPTFDGNLASTVHLLTALRLRCPGLRRFVQVGSLEEPALGSDAPPSSPYAAAKAAATAYGRMFHRLYDFPVAFARVFMVYGPGPQDENKLVPYTLRRLLAGESPSFSSGVRPVDWIFVGDVAEGLLRMALADDFLNGRRVDLGRGELHTVRQVIEEMFRIVAPDREPEFGGREDRQDEQVRKADADGTEQLLGWRPRVGLGDGLRRTAEWFRSH